MRRRLCQDKSDLSSSPGGKQRSEGGLFMTRKSESHNSLHLDLDNLQQKLSLSPSPSPETTVTSGTAGTGGRLGFMGRTKSEVFQKNELPDSPSSVNIELSCDNDSGERWRELTPPDNTDKSIMSWKNQSSAFQDD